MDRWSFYHLFIILLYVYHLLLIYHLLIIYLYPYINLSIHLFLYSSVFFLPIYFSFHPSSIFFIYLSSPISCNSVDRASSMHKASIYIIACNLSIWEVKTGGLEVQEHLWLYIKFETSRWYIRFFIRKIKNTFLKNKVYDDITANMPSLLCQSLYYA